MTGSSARKLRRGGINLLGGRAHTKYLHPLTSKELGEHFQLHRAIERGLIPSIYFSDEPGADLKACAGSYLQRHPDSLRIAGLEKIKEKKTAGFL